MLRNSWKIMARTICKDYGFKKSVLFVSCVCPTLKLLQVIVQIFFFFTMRDNIFSSHNFLIRGMTQYMFSFFCSRALIESQIV